MWCGMCGGGGSNHGTYFRAVSKIKSKLSTVRRQNLRALESSWNVMAHGDGQEGKWRGNWWMDWVASTLHTTSQHGVSSITTADAHTSAASSRLNWRPCRFKWTRPFRRKTKSGFCACAITFQTQSTSNDTEKTQHNLQQGRIKLFGAPRQWKHFRPLFQAVFLSGGGGITPPRLSQTPRLPVPRQK